MSQIQLLQIPYDYESALAILYGRINYEKASSFPYNSQNFRLDRMRDLLDKLDSPHLGFPIIHIAGTKGKGTTATLLTDALRANEFRVGLYTSPHLVRLEERFQFDGRECSPSELVSLCGVVLEAAHRVELSGLGRCTFFEITTAMSLVHFARNRADCVVLEVGLGGRLDSTNVCKPILSMITSISLDHQAQLGDTLTAIAGEKAGIIKPGIPVISTARALEAREVIQSVADAQQSPLWLIDRDFTVDWSASTSKLSVGELGLEALPSSGTLGSVATITYLGRNSSRKSAFANSTWPTRMLGRHQADNIAGVVAALQWLVEEAGWELQIDKARTALAQSHPSARLEIIAHQPVRIVDTAHNPVSISAGLQALDDHFGDCHRVVVFACSRDKDYRAMLRDILPKCNRLICTQFHSNPRAVSAQSLQSIAEEYLCLPESSRNWRTVIESAETPELAWRRALAVSSPDGLVAAMGSFFLAAELLAYLERSNRESTMKSAITLNSERV